MQPSSNTPMIALPSRSRRAAAWPSRTSAGGSLSRSRLRTWLWSCVTPPSPSHCRRPLRKYLSVKFSLHNVLYATPILVSEPFRFSMPTRPGHVPLQLATVRIGPRCVERPGRMCWLYCQTHSATISVASGSIVRNTSKPRFCESMKPCFFLRSNAWARTAVQPSALSALASVASIFDCSAQQT